MPGRSGQDSDRTRWAGSEAAGEAGEAEAAGEAGETPDGADGGAGGGRARRDAA